MRIVKTGNEVFFITAVLYHQQKSFGGFHVSLMFTNKWN